MKHVHDLALDALGHLLIHGCTAVHISADCVAHGDAGNHLARNLKRDACKELTAAINGARDKPQNANGSGFRLKGTLEGLCGEDGKAPKICAVVAHQLGAQRHHSAQCIAADSNLEQHTFWTQDLCGVKAWQARDRSESASARPKTVFTHSGPLLVFACQWEPVNGRSRFQIDAFERLGVGRLEIHHSGTGYSKMPPSTHRWHANLEQACGLGSATKCINDLCCVVVHGCYVSLGKRTLQAQANK